MGSISQPDTTKFQLSTIHFHVHDYDAAPVHYLVPTDNEQQYQELQVEGTSIPAEQPTRFSNLSKDRPFDPEMIQTQFSEQIAVAGEPYTEKSCTSFCESLADNNYKETVRFGKGWAPKGIYHSQLIVRKDCTKKNFRQKASYVFKMKPKFFGETSFCRPRHMSERYVSYLDLHPHGTHKWYRSTLDFTPKTYGDTRIHNFAFLREDDDDEYSSDDDMYYTDPENDDYSTHNGYHNGEVSVHNVNLDQVQHDVNMNQRHVPYHSSGHMVNGYLNGDLDDDVLVNL